ncbi:MAG: DUF3127 domain-containing protein [Bacteroidota bacterium]
MDVTGKLVEIFDTQQVSDRFQKREFVIEFAENPQYPEFVKFELIQDKVDLLNTFQAGQDIQVFFNLKGRKWNSPQGETKYFNTLQAWRLAAPQAQGGGGASTPPPANEAFPPGPGPEEDDLPF